MYYKSHNDDNNNNDVPLCVFAFLRVQKNVCRSRRGCCSPASREANAHDAKAQQEHANFLKVLTAHLAANFAAGVGKLRSNLTSWKITGNNVQCLRRSLSAVWMCYKHLNQLTGSQRGSRKKSKLHKNVQKTFHISGTSLVKLKSNWVDEYIPSSLAALTVLFISGSTSSRATGQQEPELLIWNICTVYTHTHIKKKKKNTDQKK